MSHITYENLSTDELIKQLQSTRSVSDLSEYTAQLQTQVNFHSFHEFFHDYLSNHKLKESEIIHASLIQRNYAYQILNGTKNPGRDKVIALCLAAKMNLDETQRALTLADYGKLYPRRKKDSVIIFALQKHLSVQQTNELLYEEKESPL